MARLQSWIARAPLCAALLFGVGFVLLPVGAMLWETVYGPDGFQLDAWSTILASEVDRAQLGYSMQLGLAATALALLFGLGYAFLTFRTDLPGARALTPLGVAPLAVPPILVAMGFADLVDAAGFWMCTLLLAASYAPFVTVMASRGMRAVDGRAYEAALLARGRGAAERLLLRSILPEILAGCLLVFVFVISEHGVPEFLTVKGKTWHTYAEGVFARWKLRATGLAHEDVVSPIIAAIPLVLIIAIALFAALRLRAHSNLRSDPRPLPIRSLGAWRWPALLLPLVYLGCGIGVPLVVMARWAGGSTQRIEPMSLGYFQQSFRTAFELAGDDLGYTVLVGVVTTLLLLLVSLPLAHFAARRWPTLESLSVLPIAVPAVLLGMGLVRVYNSPAAGAVYDHVGEFYDSWGILVCAYAARFLPFGVLTLTQAVRRQPRAIEEAAQLAGRGPLARTWKIQLPLLLPAMWSAACLIFVLALRELDVAVVLPSGNGTVVRRLSNVVHFGGEDMGGALALMLLFLAVLFPLLTLVVTGRKLRSLS